MTPVVSPSARVDALAIGLAEGVVVVGADLRVELVNPEAERILRRARHEMVGRHIDHVASEWALRDRGPYAVSKMRHHLQRRLSYRNDDAFVVGGEAGITHVSLVMTPVEVDGRDGGAVISLRDITELKLAEHVLRESEARFRAVFDLAPAGMVRITADGTVTDCNQAFSELVGGPDEGLEGSVFAELVHPADRSSVDELLAALLQGQRARSDVELRYGRPDGSEVWTSTSLAAVRGRNRQADFVVAVVEDLTARRHLEVERRHAQKLEAVARLSGGLAHELNTPIQFVQDNVRFLAEAFHTLSHLLDAYRARNVSPGDATVPGPETEADVAFLAEEVPISEAEALEGLRRMAAIVTAMKAFGEPPAGHRTPVDLNEAVRTALVVASSEIDPVADVVVELGALPLVSCELADVNQVLLHLLSNAAHAVADEVARRGRGRISVRTWAEEAGVAVAVEDTGPGIRDEVAARMFDPFFTTKVVGQGTGQGLALAHTVIVGRHGGRLSFDTRLGEGTTFVVRLPVALAEEHQREHNDHLSWSRSPMGPVDAGQADVHPSGDFLPAGTPEEGSHEAS